MLLIGLGNNGEEYANTRHNVGFNFVDLLSDKSSIILKKHNRLNCHIGSGLYLGQKITLCRPISYMNLSGNAILSILSFYKMHTNQIVIVHDDIDLELGVIKNKFAGSSAGHNGIRSIDKCIGNKYHRIRIGIGRPQNHLIQVADFVLQNFEFDESQILSNTMNNFLENKLLHLMCVVNVHNL